MAETTPEQAHAQCVLARWLRAYKARRVHANLVHLATAFRNAPAHQCFPPIGAIRSTRPPTEELRQKRLTLSRKYSTLCVRPPTPVASDPHALVSKSTMIVSDPHDAENASSSDDREGEPHHDHVTIEVVVQHLHAQLQVSRAECATKDERIRALEALLQSLVVENKRVIRELEQMQSQSTKTNEVNAIAGGHESNQTTFK